MKPVIKLSILTIITLCVASQITFAEDVKTPETAVNVRQLMTDTGQYPDTVTVQGMVSKVFPQDKMIGLIDHPDIKGCDIKTCKTPCPVSNQKQCTRDIIKNCPMTAAQDTAAPKCPMAGDKPCNKTCDKALSKKCPMKGSEDSCKTGSMASAENTVQDSGKKCPMTGAVKDCPKTTGKGCTRPCSAPGSSLILPVHWEGEMPEPASMVNISGKITQKDGRMLFEAESVKVLNN